MKRIIKWFHGKNGERIMLFPIFSLCAGTPLVLLAQSSGSSIVAALTIATVMGVTIGGSLGVAVTFEGSEK